MLPEKTYFISKILEFQQRFSYSINPNKTGTALSYELGRVFVYKEGNPQDKRVKCLCNDVL